MPSITEAKAELVNLAERLRTVAETLRHLPADHPSFYDEMEGLRGEMKVIAARLRGINRPSGP
jgi:hypothetical protein